jgi:hypothetical protein
MKATTDIKNSKNGTLTIEVKVPRSGIQAEDELQLEHLKAEYAAKFAAVHEYLLGECFNIVEGEELEIEDGEGISDRGSWRASVLVFVININLSYNIDYILLALLRGDIQVDALLGVKLGIK